MGDRRNRALPSSVAVPAIRPVSDVFSCVIGPQARKRMNHRRTEGDRAWCRARPLVVRSLADSSLSRCSRSPCCRARSPPPPAARPTLVHGRGGDQSRPRVARARALTSLPVGRCGSASTIARGRRPAAAASARSSGILPAADGRNQRCQQRTRRSSCGDDAPCAIGGGHCAIYAAPAMTFDISSVTSCLPERDRASRDGHGRRRIGRGRAHAARACDAVLRPMPGVPRRSGRERRLSRAVRAKRARARISRVTRTRPRRSRASEARASIVRSRSEDEIGSLAIPTQPLSFSTGTQTKTLTAANPFCSGDLSHPLSLRHLQQRRRDAVFDQCRLRGRRCDGVRRQALHRRFERRQPLHGQQRMPRRLVRPPRRAAEAEPMPRRHGGAAGRTRVHRHRARGRRGRIVSTARSTATVPGSNGTKAVGWTAIAR